MTPDILGPALAKFRRPGMIKALAGQLAIAIGSSLVAQTVDEAQERRDIAHDELEMLTARIEAGHSGLIEMINSGEFDSVVMARAAALGWQPAADPLDEDCGDPTCGDVGHVHRTPPNGAPNGNPDVPPRMAGGYLPAAGGLLTEGSGGGEYDVQHNGKPFTNSIEPDRASADAD